MEKSTKRTWKVSSVLITLAIAMGLLSTMVFADSVSDSFEDETKIADKSNVEVAGGQVKLTGGVLEQPDQENPNHSGHLYEVKDKKWVAQSFRASVTANLTKIALYLKKEIDSGELTIDIRNVGQTTNRRAQPTPV